MVRIKIDEGVLQIDLDHRVDARGQYNQREEPYKSSKQVSAYKKTSDNTTLGKVGFHGAPLRLVASSHTLRLPYTSWLAGRLRHVSNAIAHIQSKQNNASASSGYRSPVLPAGLPPLQASAPSVGAVAKIATRLHLPFDASFPGLRVVHADPPIIVVDGFISIETCDALATAADTSGFLAPSAIGAATAGSARNRMSERRTSHSMLVTDEVLKRSRKALANAQREIRDKAQVLLSGLQWSTPGQLPPPGEVCFEMLQVARYEEGQHFLAHEDAFPRLNARSNGFQRLATVLVYLNDVPEGGETRFEHLGVSVHPAAGTALLFFPAFADGTPDPRTIHTATDAVNTKWIAQQWIAAGWSDQPISFTGGSTRPSGTPRKEGRPKKKKQESSRGQGFGR